MKKRKDGRYAKQVTVGIKNGKPIKKTVYGKTIKELDKNFRDLMLLVDKGVILDNQSITLNELIQEWYRIKLEGKIKCNSANAYSSILKRIKNAIGEMKVKDITMYTVESLITDIKKEGFYNLAQSILNMLRTIFDYAIMNDIIIKNPCNGLSVKYTKKIKRVLTEDEKSKLLNLDILTDKEQAIILLLRYTGMRRGEIFSLKKSDIDKKNMVININKTLVDNNGNAYIQEDTKTSAGTRNIPIFLPLAKTLFSYIENINDDELLFLNNNGKLMAVNSIRWQYVQIIKKLGLGEDLTMHCFRHNFISECYMAGIDVKKLQKWVGHSDISTTLNIYTHLDKQMLQDGDAMNDFYSNNKTVKKQSKSQKGISIIS